MLALLGGEARAADARPTPLEWIARSHVCQRHSSTTGSLAVSRTVAWCSALAPPSVRSSWARGTLSSARKSRSSSSQGHGSLPRASVRAALVGSGSSFSTREACGELLKHVASERHELLRGRRGERSAESPCGSAQLDDRPYRGLLLVQLESRNTSGSSCSSALE